MNSRVKLILEIMAAIAAIITLCIAVIALIPAFGQWLFPISPIPTSTNSSLVITPHTQLVATATTLYSTDTPSSSNTQLPTSMPFPTIQPTATIIPSSPTPIISLPFTDNFSNSSNPAWNFVAGEWFVKDNSLSTLPIANAYEWAFLDDQSLRDYQVKVKVYIPNMYSGNDADARIIFRHDPSRARQLTMVVDWWGNVYIGMMDNIQQRIPTALSDNRAYSVSSANFTMVLQVKGDTFTAFLDGQQVGVVTMKGFDNGGVGLGVTCFYTCPSFSNFSLQPLP